ncbi:fractalkine isoform X2 [Otolemur garnettii]|uniref:C-X3-C motif chemokine ligand 1 n=1 Tax=Otolemur garnettii TaxID=30611 RepID=H0XH65_OTOGA|nr:fractalkine isoform X2 [Otolemur garnettii]
MALLPLSWLLRVAALCHLIILLAGQHHGVKKCQNECSQLTRKPIPVALLVGYENTQKSCSRHAIIFKTKQSRSFCADPNQKWVQETMARLDSMTAAPTQSAGKFEKQIGGSTSRTTPATRRMNESAVLEPDATGGSHSLGTTPSQEAVGTLGTSPDLSMGVAGSWATRFPTSKAQDGGPSARPMGTESSSMAAVSTATTWQSSAAYPPGSGLWTERMISEGPSTQAPSTQAPTISHPDLEENTGSEDQLVWTEGQSPIPASTDAFQDWGPGAVAHDPVVPVSSEGITNREPVASGSWVPKAEETTGDPQSLRVLISPAPDPQAATRRQAVGLLAFLGLLFCLGVVMFAYQSLQGCPRRVAGEVVEGLRYVPRSCGSNSYVLVPV